VSAGRSWNQIRETSSSVRRNPQRRSTTPNWQSTKRRRSTCSIKSISPNSKQSIPLLELVRTFRWRQKLLLTETEEGKRPKLEPHTSTSTRSSSHENIERQDSGSRFTNGYGFGVGVSESGPLIGDGSPGSGRPGYSVASASTSPAGYASHQSPIVGSAYSPKSTSPASASAYLAYELPHHGRAGNALDPRFREPAYPIARSHGSPLAPFPPPPLEVDSMDRSPLNATSPKRGLSRPSPSLPPLVHQDTSLSSDSGSTPALTPYQGSLLPVLDAPKGERMLPQPIPTMGLVTSPSPLDPRHVSSAPRGQGHLEALLRATELARDADEKELRDRLQ